MPTSDVRKQVAMALEAVENKKAEDVALLQLPSESSTFTDYFLICSGQNPRQVQAIADEVDERLSKRLGVEPNNREGYQTGEWILLDYVDFVVHIFNAQRRAYYDLERLWKSAHRLTAAELLHPPKVAKPKAAAAPKRPAGKAARKAPAKAAKKSARGKKVSAKRASTKKAAAKKTSPAKSRGTARATTSKTKTPTAKKKSAKRK
jgi:ribosome-associated protein